MLKLTTRKKALNALLTGNPIRFDENDPDSINIGATETSFNKILEPFGLGVMRSGNIWLATGLTDIQLNPRFTVADYVSLAHALVILSADTITETEDLIETTASEFGEKLEMTEDERQAKAKALVQAALVPYFQNTLQVVKVEDAEDLFDDSNKTIVIQDGIIDVLSLWFQSIVVKKPLDLPDGRLLINKILKEKVVLKEECPELFALKNLENVEKIWNANSRETLTSTFKLELNEDYALLLNDDEVDPDEYLKLTKTQTICVYLYQNYRNQVITKEIAKAAAEELNVSSFSFREFYIQAKERKLLTADDQISPINKRYDNDFFTENLNA